MRYIMNVQKSSRIRWSLLLLILASAYFLVVYVLQADPASLRAEPTSGTCIHHQRHLIAKGRTSEEKPWTVMATIRNNGSCNYWLLGMEFFPSGTYAGSWRGAWGIPAGGHLPQSFTISAQDESEGSKRAFSGVVSARVKAVVLTMSNNARFTIHPKLPPLRLRERFVWLRNMRYFMYLYPAGKNVKTVTLLSGCGKVIEKLSGLEGGFEGSGV